MPDPDRFDGNRYDGNRYDGNRSDQDRGYSYNNEALDALRSKTPAERKADRENRDNKSAIDTQKGADGIERTYGGVTRITPQVTRPAGEQPLYRVTVGLCVAGAAGHMDVAAYELPTPN